jgi:putative salt-induced outer membrane protein YdiY
VVFCDRVTWARIAGGRTAHHSRLANDNTSTFHKHYITCASIFAHSLSFHYTSSHSNNTFNSPPTQLLTIHNLQSKPHHNIMPKEKVTRGKGKATKADGGKKKKG